MPDFLSRTNHFLTAVLLILFSIAAVSAQENLQKWDDFDFAALSVKQADIESLELYELKLLRGVIFGRHGRVFKDVAIRKYLSARPRYRPNPDFKNAMLNDVERGNLDLIRDAEASKHEQVEPGDLEFFEDRLITDQMLKGLSLHELRLLRNEIYARHGRQFRAAWLQQYFWSQPWYEQNEDFLDDQLSGSDKQNVETIVKYENRIHDELGTKAITRSLLEGLFVEDASKMRQEIYARRGKVFKEPWLQKYFVSFDWYKPDPQFTENSLSDIEKKNVATLQAYEKKAVSALDVIEG